ncbi:MAG: DUF2147 domain-containing protein [Ginsengibacter sp.]
MKPILGSLICFFAITSFAQNNPDAIIGKWMTTSGSCLVEVYKQNMEYKAKILWLKEGNKPLGEWTDEKNHDPLLRTRKIIGMDVLHGLHYDPTGNNWVDGIIYDVSTGKEWDSEVWLTNDNLLKVKGYWAFKFLSQTKTFKKV